MSKNYYREDDDFSELLLGRKIESTEIREIREGYKYGVLTLDNGVRIMLDGNEGCGGCGNGWYYIETLNKVDNIITNVKVVRTKRKGSWNTVYKIFVIANDELLELASFEGDDGNGYYGTGFTLTVVQD